MKKILSCLSILFFPFMGIAQYPFVSPSNIPDLNCHTNVNERTDQDYRNELKRAIFRLTIGINGPNCSATLMNRNTGQNSLGQYFVTAWHCFKSGSNCGGSEFNFNNPVVLTFNYQSPNSQSLVFQQNATGSEYQITRQVRLVDKVSCAYGDFALCEILGDPIPPHFNAYYAGWFPNELFINLGGQFAAIHHPGSSIKKISGVNNISGQGTPKTTCRVITKVIDFLFGWIWGRRWSTQVICTYVQLPFYGTKYKAMGYQFGKMEDGSSGGGLFTGNAFIIPPNRFVGDLSGSLPSHTCNTIDLGIDFYGKFPDNFYRQSVKNTLNPPHKYWIDQNGIPGRGIACYPTLNIKSETTNGFNLYPANLYQQENNIVLSAQTTAITTGTIRVMDGAQFTFQAGNSVTLNPGFEAQGGSVFTAQVTGSPCFISNNTYKTGIDQDEEYETPDMSKLLSEMPYPIEKEFDITKYLPAEKTVQAKAINKFLVYPNPSSGSVHVEIYFKSRQDRIRLILYDLNGKAVYSKYYTNPFFIDESLNLPSLPGGLYNLVIETASGADSKKLVLVK